MSATDVVQSSCIIYERSDPNIYKELMFLSFIISIITFTFTIYMLLFQSPTSLKYYRLIILNHIIWCQLFETGHAFLTCFDVILKIYGFDQLGVLKYILSGRSGVIIMGTTLFIMLSTYIHMLYYILLRILPDNHFLSKFRVFEARLYFVIYIGGSLWTSCICLLAFPANQAHSKFITFSQQNVCLTDFFKSNTVSVFNMDQKEVIFFLAFLAVLIAISLLLGLWKISWSYWRHSLIRFSKQSRETNKMLLYALLIQTTLVCLIVIVPGLGCLVCFVLSIELSELTRVMMLIIAQHSTISHVVLLTATKPYKDSFKRFIVTFPRKNVRRLKTVTQTTRDSLQKTGELTTTNVVSLPRG